jgi:hypothetical protein
VEDKANVEEPVLSDAYHYPSRLTRSLLQSGNENQGEFYFYFYLGSFICRKSLC